MDCDPLAATAPCAVAGVRGPPAGVAATGRAVDIQPATFVGFVLFVALRASAEGAVVSSAPSCQREAQP
jgi:hypothetical protein